LVMENGAKVLTFIQLRKSSLFYVWLWMSGGAATEKSGCAVLVIERYTHTFIYKSYIITGGLSPCVFLSITPQNYIFYFVIQRNRRVFCIKSKNEGSKNDGPQLAVRADHRFIALQMLIFDSAGLQIRRSGNTAFKSVLIHYRPDQIPFITVS